MLHEIIEKFTVGESSLSIRRINKTSFASSFLHFNHLMHLQNYTREVPADLIYSNIAVTLIEQLHSMDLYSYVL